MTYHPVDKTRYDVASFDSGRSYIGTEWADKVEDFGRNLVGGIHAASQDQEGWHDDALRFGGKLLQGAGKVAEAPGIKQTLQLLDAPVHYLAEGAGNVAENLGVDPRLAKWGVRAAETALTMGGGIAKKTGKLDDLARLAGNRMDELALAGINRMPTGNVSAYSDLATQASLRPSGYKNTAKWNKWVKKFGTEKGARQAADIEADALKFWNAQKKINADGKGSLKDFGTIREIEGKQYYIKNKANSLKEPNFNYDPLDKTIAGRILREQSAKVDEKMVKKAVDRINKNRKKMGTDLITDEQVAQYIAAQKKNKADLKKLIRNLNYDEGKRTWSLGHIEAVKSHTDKGKAGADMITNLELEPFRDMFDEATGKWIRGNASRSNIDELEDILLQAINKAETIDEDIIKFLDSDIGNFWPRKIGVKDRKTWLKESGKMEEYIETLKKKGVDQTLTDSDFGTKSLKEPAPIPKMKI